MRKFVHLILGGSAIYEKCGENLITHESTMLDSIQYEMLITLLLRPGLKSLVVINSISTLKPISGLDSS